MFKCNTYSKDILQSLLVGIKHHRSVKVGLDTYCSQPPQKVLALYGLQGTGKSTLMHQKAFELMDVAEHVNNVIYFEFNSALTYNDINKDLLWCARSARVKYVFIDEFTSIQDYSFWSFMLYRLLIRAGKHVIISGTDSYKIFLLDSINPLNIPDEQSTTELWHIPPFTYAEHIKLSGAMTMSTYIRNGGLLSSEPIDWENYIKAAVVKNVVSHGFGKQIPSSRSFHYLLNISEPDITSLLDNTLFQYSFNTLRAIMPTMEPSFADSAPSQTPDDSIGVYSELWQLLIDMGMFSQFVEQPNKDSMTSTYILTVPGLRYHQLRTAVECLKAVSPIPNAQLKQINTAIDDYLFKLAVLSETLSYTKYSSCHEIVWGFGIDMALIYTPTRTAYLYSISRTKSEIEPATADSIEEFKRFFNVSAIGAINAIYNGKAHKQTIEATDESDATTVNYLNVQDYMKSLAECL